MKNADIIWMDLVKKLMAFGCQVPSRNGMTYELINQHLTFSAVHCVIQNDARKLSYSFMAAEAYWILSGQNELAPLLPYAPSMEKYSDDGLTLSGAYGPRVMSQIQYVIRTLASDIYSRQAVLTIWDRNPAPSKDIPCTISLQFLYRKGKLDVIVNMRSSDIWLGIPYDLFTFSMILCYVYLALRRYTNVEMVPGSVHFNLGSSHLYEHNLQKAHLAKDINLGNREFLAISLYDCNTPDDLLYALGNKRDCPRNKVLTLP